MTSHFIGTRLRLVIAVSMVAAVMALVPSVSAASHKDFALTKTCDVEGTLCIVQTSTFAAISGGTKITYTYDNSVPWDGLAFPTITVGNGSSTGVCDWNQPPDQPVLAICTFGTGTGRLTQFNLVVKVTLDGELWHWDGWYSFGGAD